MSTVGAAALASLVALVPAALAAPSWQTLETADGSHASARHEAGAVVVDGALYLVGGRGRPPLERYAPDEGGWRDLGQAPRELHHFQPVALDGTIYVVGAFTCCYPIETPVAEIHAYDTASETWDVVGSMPPDRVRGSTAAIVRDGRIYVLGGNTRGHDGGAVPWFDEYDPASGTWRVLPDAPHARDHFTAALVGDRLVAAAGRRSTMPGPAANPVLATDVYDFTSGTWRTAAPIPTARGGTVTVSHGGEVIVVGGEINTSPTALDAVEAFDPGRGEWRALAPLGTGRHGAGGGVVDGALHVVAGASSLGGAVETHRHETLRLEAAGAPDGHPSGGGDAPADPTGSAEGDTAAEGGADDGSDDGADDGADVGTGGPSDDGDGSGGGADIVVPGPDGDAGTGGTSGTTDGPTDGPTRPTSGTTEGGANGTSGADGTPSGGERSGGGGGAGWAFAALLATLLRRRAPGTIRVPGGLPVRAA